MLNYFGVIAVVIVVCAPLSDGIQPESWHPVIQHTDLFGKSPFDGQTSFGNVLAQGYQNSPLHTRGDQCEVYKVGFIQDLYFQYVLYKTEIPEMKEFTLCFWTKFTNHSNDHPVFSYAVDGQPRAIYSWVSNTERSSYFSLSVEGHTFYRLNYPLRLNRWYHTCQSWNGKTGEWQIWVNAERVGRGFHNRLVGHTIPSGGIAISGQEQSQLGGGFQEGKDAPKGAGGMLGELTMVQLYSVALTAGKAHRDHKHHHAHQYDHNGVLLTTPAPTSTSPRNALPTHPLLTGGQINPALMLNFAGGQPTQPPQPQIVPGQQFDAQFLNGQFVGSLVTQQLSGTRNIQGQQQFQSLFPEQPQQLQLLPTGQSNSFQSQQQPPITSGLVHPSLVNPANVQFIDNTQLDTHQLFKRHNKDNEKTKKVENEPKFGDKIKKRETTGENKHKKRELYLDDGTIIQGSAGSLLHNEFEQSLLNGLAGIGDNQPVLQQQKERDEREPAEAEVKAVMSICSGCDQEPFDKALVFGWRTVNKKLYSGAFYTPAVPECKVF